MVQELLENEKMPDRWNQAFIHPLLKKNETAKKQELQENALVGVAYIVVAILIKETLQIKMENIVRVSVINLASDT